MIDPEETFDEILDTADLNTAWNTSMSLLNATYTRSSMRGEDYAAEPYNLLSVRIVDFVIEPIWDNGEATLSSKRDASIILPMNINNTVLAGSVPVGLELSALRVSLTVINEEGDKLLRAGIANASLAQGTPDEITFYERYTDTFVRTIPLVVAPY